jgi:hypothetical protein
VLLRLLRVARKTGVARKPSEGIFFQFVFCAVFLAVKRDLGALDLKPFRFKLGVLAEELRHEATNAENYLLFGGVISDAGNRETMAATDFKKLGCGDQFIQPGVGFEGRGRFAAAS